MYVRRFPLRSHTYPTRTTQTAATSQHTHDSTPKYPPTQNSACRNAVFPAQDGSWSAAQTYPPNHTHAKQVLGPDVQEFNYVSWTADQDAYAYSGQKCSAQSILFAHENWVKAGLEARLKVRVCVCASFESVGWGGGGTLRSFLLFGL